MSLKSLLTEARRKKQLQQGDASAFNFENAFQEFAPDEVELSDVLSYSESSFFPKWKGSFEKLGGVLNVADAAKLETLEGGLNLF
jgi:hypothetical protein